MMDSSPLNAHKSQMQQVYTDLNQLQSLRQYGEKDKDLALKEVAKQFESFFLQMMMSSMRSANEVFGEGNMLNSSEMEFYQDMYDNQLSLSLSQGNSSGLADALYQQLKRGYSPDQTIAPGVDKLTQRINKNPYLEPKAVLKQRHQDSIELDGISSPADFVRLATPYAKKVAETLNVDYKVLIAQTALETGWGKHLIKDANGQHSFNFFNIKATSRWQGESVSVPTIEYEGGVAQREVARFRQYNSIADSFKDFQQLLTQPRYEKALDASQDPYDFATELQEAGYATDPLYAQKIHTILNSSVFSEEKGL